LQEAGHQRRRVYSSTGRKWSWDRRRRYSTAMRWPHVDNTAAWWEMVKGMWYDQSKRGTRRDRRRWNAPLLTQCY